MTDDPIPPDNDIDDFLEELDATIDTDDFDMDEAPRLERADLSALMRNRESHKPSDITQDDGEDAADEILTNLKPARPKGLFSETSDLAPVAVESPPPSEVPIEPSAASDESPESEQSAVETVPDPILAIEETIAVEQESATPIEEMDIAPEIAADQSEEPAPVAEIDEPAAELPEAATTEPAEASETADETAAESSEEQATDTPEEAAPPPIIYHYRVALVLPTPLEMLLNNIRQGMNLPTAAVGTFVLQPDFECTDTEQLKAVVKKWVDKNLPLKLTADRVEAAVVGEQRYVASWGLEPAEKFQKMHKSLVDALAPHIQLIAQDPLPFESRLVVSDRTPADQFPRLIHLLQTRFQEHEWSIQAVEILRAEAGDERWEVFEKFSRE